MNNITKYIGRQFDSYFCQIFKQMNTNNDDAPKFFLGLTTERNPNKITNVAYVNGDFNRCDPDKSVWEYYKSQSSNPDNVQPIHLHLIHRFNGWMPRYPCLQGSEVVLYIEGTEDIDEMFLYGLSYAIDEGAKTIHFALVCTGQHTVDIMMDYMRTFIERKRQVKAPTDHILKMQTFKSVFNINPPTAFGFGGKYVRYEMPYVFETIDVHLFDTKGNLVI